MSMRITKVYTKSGDDGTTGLVGGQRLRKDHARIESYGTVDELMAAMACARVEFSAEHVGRVRSAQRAADFAGLLEYMQNLLFTLGGELATRVEDLDPRMPVIGAGDVEFLERACDAYNAELPALKDFVLPGGSRTSAALHVARTVARRAERCVVALAAEEPVGAHCAVFLNRFSDALFVLCRWVNREMQVPEVLWRHGMKPPALPGVDDAGQ